MVWSPRDNDDFFGEPQEEDKDTAQRATELHEGCQMPMEQARELAASEANPDWYARGQDWALADSLSGSLPLDWTAGDIARAYAAGAEAKTTMKVEISADPAMLRRAMAAETEAALLRAALDQKHAEYDDMKSLLLGNVRNVHVAGERAREVLRRMLEAPTTQISTTWKDAARQGLALGPNVEVTGLQRPERTDDEHTDFTGR